MTEKKSHSIENKTKKGALQTKTGEKNECYKCICVFTCLYLIAMNVAYRSRLFGSTNG